MTGSRLELVILQFDRDSEGAGRFVEQTDRSGHVHVVIALTAKHHWDGSVAIEEAATRPRPD